MTTIPGFTAAVTLEGPTAGLYGGRYEAGRSTGESVTPSMWARFYCKDVYPDGTSSAYYRCWVWV